MKWFWKSDSNVEGAKQSLRDSVVDLERTRRLQQESANTANQLRALGKSNGFTEAIAFLYQGGSGKLNTK